MSENKNEELKKASEKEREEMNTPAPQSRENPVGRIALGVLPFSPAPFTGKHSWIAYARLGAYSLGAVAAFRGNQKTLGYALLGATALSAATSLSAKAWNG